MIDDRVVLLVEGDIVIRHPLAEYLRACGFRVLEAADGETAKQALLQSVFPVDIALIDIVTPGAGFELATWARANAPSTEVMLAGSLERTAEKAGDLCNDGPALVKPYEHKIVLDHIKQSIARRRRNA
jgi:DNA-binding response OmpR family regulator